MVSTRCGCGQEVDPVSYKETKSVREVLDLDIKFGLKDVAKSAHSIFKTVTDEVSDITVAITYFNDGEMKSFALIIGILIISSLATTIVSMYWFKETTSKLNLEVRPRQWVFRFLFHIFQCGIIWRHVEYISCILRSRRKPEDREKYAEYLTLMKQEAGLLSLFSAYLESAPELILQICLLASPTPGHPSEFKPDMAMVLRLISILLSIYSLAGAVPGLQDTLRDLQPSKPKLTKLGKIVRFLWHFLGNASRAIALGLFASVFPVYTVLVCAGHWLIVTIWLFLLRLRLLEQAWEEIVFKPMIGLVYIFTYFKVMRGSTLKACCIFYVMMFLEGSVMLFFWIQNCDPELWFQAIMFAAFFACFLCGVAFMGMYYCVFHPTRNLKNSMHIDTMPITDYDDQLNHHAALYEMEHPTPASTPCVPRQYIVRSDLVN